MSLLKQAIEAMENESNLADPKTPLEVLQVLGEFVRICDRFTKAIEDAYSEELTAKDHSSNTDDGNTDDLQNLNAERATGNI